VKHVNSGGSSKFRARVATCEVVDSDHRGTTHFRILEYLLLENGRRYCVASGLGFSSRNNSGQTWRDRTPAILEEHVRTVVDAYENETDEMWSRCVEVAAAVGSGDSLEDLKRLPLLVELSRSILVELNRR
jgi:hypothetical protein